MKKALICLSIVAIVVFCTLNVATASTGNYSTTVHNNARHTGDRIPMVRGSTPNGRLKWSYVTEGTVLPSPTVANGVIYIGSLGNYVYALNATTGANIWNYTTGNGPLYLCAL